MAKWDTSSFLGLWKKVARSEDELVGMNAARKLHNEEAELVGQAIPERQGTAA